MRKLISGIIVLVFLLGGVWFGTQLFHPSHSSSYVSPAGNQSIVVPTSKQHVLAAQTKQPGTPEHLSIPSIGVDTVVESVGLDSQKRMDVPKGVQDVGWYDLGFKPGEKGSAVIDGHYDTVTGAPAAFWNLGKLRPGDSVTVTDSLGKTYTFQVSQVTSYPYNQVPLQQVFASTDRARLNLITCAGTWDATNHNYSNRTVVYTELAQSQQ